MLPNDVPTTTEQKVMAPGLVTTFSMENFKGQSAVKSTPLRCASLRDGAVPLWTAAGPGKDPKRSQRTGQGESGL